MAEFEKSAKQDIKSSSKQGQPAYDELKFTPANETQNIELEAAVKAVLDAPSHKTPIVMTADNAAGLTAEEICSNPQDAAEMCKDGAKDLARKIELNSKYHGPYCDNIGDNHSVIDLADLTRFEEFKEKHGYNKIATNEKTDLQLAKFVGSHEAAHSHPIGRQIGDRVIDTLIKNDPTFKKLAEIDAQLVVVDPDASIIKSLKTAVRENYADMVSYLSELRNAALTELGISQKGNSGITIKDVNRFYSKIAKHRSGRMEQDPTHNSGPMLDQCIKHYGKNKDLIRSIASMDNEQLAKEAGRYIEEQIPKLEA
jgi:hypothetical protein